VVTRYLVQTLMRTHSIFLLSTLSYNLFALMRQLLPIELPHHRGITLRWRLYAMAAKVVKTSRQLYVKLQTKKPTPLRASASSTEGV